MYLKYFSVIVIKLYHIDHSDQEYPVVIAEIERYLLLLRVQAVQASVTHRGAVLCVKKSAETVGEEGHCCSALKKKRFKVLMQMH